MTDSIETAVSLTVNGHTCDLRTPTSEVLLDTLRDRLGLTGANLGCDHASCGACTVLVDDDPRASCSTFTWSIQGRSVTTIEGLGTPGDLSPEQQAFSDASAFQCGYCTPGLIMTTAAMLRAVPDPDPTTISEWLSSNLCRCTGYKMVIEAAQAAASARTES